MSTKSDTTETTEGCIACGKPTTSHEVSSGFVCHTCWIDPEVTIDTDAAATGNDPPACKVCSEPAETYLQWPEGPEIPVCRKHHLALKNRERETCRVILNEYRDQMPAEVAFV